MAYGLRVKDAVGNIVVDTTDWLFRIRYSNVVAGEASSNVVLADIDGKTTELVSIALEDDKLAHDVTRSGTTITWTAKSGGAGGYIHESSDSLIIVLSSD